MTHSEDSIEGAERIVGKKVTFKVIRRPCKKGCPPRIQECEGRIVDLTSQGVVVIGENVSGRYSRSLHEIEVRA